MKLVKTVVTKNQEDNYAESNQTIYIYDEEPCHETSNLTSETKPWARDRASVTYSAGAGTNAGSSYLSEIDYSGVCSFIYSGRSRGEKIFFRALTIALLIMIKCPSRRP